MDIVRNVFALVRNCTNFVLAYWNGQIIRLSAFTLKVLRKAVMRKEENITQYHTSEGQRLSIVVSFSSVFGGLQHYHTPKMLQALIC